MGEVKNPLATEPVGKLIGKFAIPAVISMLVNALYNIVDQIFIGQGVGMLGNAATNIAFPITIIATAIALLLGIGGASIWNDPRSTALCDGLCRDYCVGTAIFCVDGGR